MMHLSRARLVGPKWLRICFVITICFVAALTKAQTPAPTPRASSRPTPKASPAPTPKVTPTQVPTPLPKSATPQDSPPAKVTFIWWRDLPWTFLAAFVAVAGVLTNAYVSHKVAEAKRKSDEDTASDRLAQEKSINTERMKQEKDIARAKEEREALQHARKELQDQFIDIQNRLTQAEPMIRANAAMRLGEFARTPKPQVVKDVEGETVEGILSHTQDNYPYFAPSLAQLSIALYLEPRSEVRKAIKYALSRVVDFAKDGEGQPFLYQVIERLIDANKTAKEIFIKAFANWTVVDKTWGELLDDDSDDSIYRYFDQNGNTLGDAEYERMVNLTSSIAPFCVDASATRDVLETLMSEGRIENGSKIVRQSHFYVQREKYSETRNAQADAAEKSKTDALALPELERSAQQLMDTRDCLCIALKALSKPMNLPSSVDGNTVWERDQPIILVNCFLPGADLDNADLQEVNLNSSYLQAASLIGADLQFTAFWAHTCSGVD